MLLELIDRIAALVPPPRTHRHCYFGVLGPNSPLRAAVTAMATPTQTAAVLGAPTSTAQCALGAVPMGSALRTQSEQVLSKRRAHYLWAVLIARIYEVFPEPPHIAPARGPPLWDDCDAHTVEGVAVEPDWATDWDGPAQPAPDYEVDQRTGW